MSISLIGTTNVSYRRYWDAYCTAIMPSDGSQPNYKGWHKDFLSQGGRVSNGHREDTSVRICHADGAPYVESEGPNEFGTRPGYLMRYEGEWGRYGSGDSAYQRISGSSHVGMLSKMTHYASAVIMGIPQTTYTYVYLFWPTERSRYESGVYKCKYALGHGSYYAYKYGVLIGFAHYERVEKDGSVVTVVTGGSAKPGTDFNPEYMYLRDEPGFHIQDAEPSDEYVERMISHCDQRFYTTPVGIFSDMFNESMSSLEANTNTMANVKQAIDLIKQFKKYGPAGLLSKYSSADAASTAANAWLSYRYSYCTTKSDVQEYNRYLKQLDHLCSNATVDLYSRRVSSGVTYNVRTKVTPTYVNMLTSLKDGLRSVGLDPTSIEDLWDMLPWSFVIDWFAKIGDYARFLETDYYRDDARWDFGSITFSKSYQGTAGTPAQLDAGIVQFYYSYYERTVQTSPPEMVWYEEDVSNRTVARRCIDALSFATNFKGH